MPDEVTRYRYRYLAEHLWLVEQVTAEADGPIDDVVHRPANGWSRP